jgi:hypothetical protein
MHLRIASTVTLAAMAAAWSGAVFAQGFAERAERALAEPMIGLTTDGTPIEGLFEIAETGISTEPVRGAAEQLLAALTPEQREAMTFPVTHTEWRNWANIHAFPREGVSLDEMTDSQRQATYTLLRESLSARGYQTTRDIMRLNHHLAELVDNFDAYGEHLYWVTMMGLPSADEPWGWQLDGHHLIINYFILGDQIVMTPTFMGSEPTVAESGIYAGTSVLEEEQDRGFAFMQSLSVDQQQTAVLDSAKRRGENLAEMFSDNVVVPYQGIAATSLSASPARRTAGPDRTVGQSHAAGSRERENGRSSRTHGQHLVRVARRCRSGRRLLLPDTQSGDLDRVRPPGSCRAAGPRDVAMRRHVHSVVRTPNGNDYGADLLRQHYESYRDDPDHGHTVNLHGF